MISENLLKRCRRLIDIKVTINNGFKKIIFINNIEKNKINHLIFPMNSLVIAIFKLISIILLIKTILVLNI
jgi:hypothetical protein